MKWSFQPSEVVIPTKKSGQNYHEISHYNLYGLVIMLYMHVLYIMYPSQQLSSLYHALYKKLFVCSYFVWF